MALPAVLAGAASAIGRAVATQAGRKAVLEGAKKYGKKALEAGNTKAGQALTAGQMASNVGMQQANRPTNATTKHGKSKSTDGSSGKGR